MKVVKEAFLLVFDVLGECVVMYSNPNKLGLPKVKYLSKRPKATRIYEIADVKSKTMAISYDLHKKV
jgi:hypothetical protein